MTPDQLSRRSSTPSRPSSTTATSACPTASRPRSWSSVRGARSTATTPPTSRSSWPRRRAANPRELAGLVAERLRASAGRRCGRHRRSRVPQHHGLRRRRRAVAIDVAGRRVRRTAAPTRWPASGSTSSSSRPTRPARCTWATPGGPPSATPWRGSSRRPAPSVTREFYINDRGAQMDKFGASLEASAKGEPVPEDGYHGAYVADLAQQIVGRRAGHPRPARRRAAGRVPRGRLPAAARRPAGAARGVPHPLRRVVLRARRCTPSSGRATAWRRCATRATSSTPTARCGCAPPTSATTRTGCWSGQRRADLLRRRHGVLPRQARAAASTSASTCSVPTTTATSAGCGRWRRARATTPTATSRC